MQNICRKRKSPKYWEKKNICLREVSHGHDGTDSASCQGEMPLCREGCRALKISSEFKKQAK